MTGESGDEKPPTTAERVIPPHNGFGSDEDSLGNCLSLLPRPPKRNLTQLMQLDQTGTDGRVLRFLARLQLAAPDPSGVSEQRRFIISYFLADGTLSVFEQASRNSGMYPIVLFLHFRQYAFGFVSLFSSEHLLT